MDTCDCSNSYLWLIAIIMLFLVMLLIAIYCAFSSRTLFIYTVNDTWNCGICIYVIAGFGAFGIIGGFASRNDPTMYFGLVALSILLCVSIVLFVMFFAQGKDSFLSRFISWCLLWCRHHHINSSKECVCS